MRRTTANLRRLRCSKSIKLRYGSPPDSFQTLGSFSLRASKKRPLLLG